MDATPHRIGPYEIVELIGEGGTGKVYLAEQREPLRRTVAVKVLEAIEHSERALVRFEIERLALAVMDHPSIAKVYDAGITEAGSPYVVMELVDGTPIGQYCDAHRLTIRERVQLFTEACRAVHHAHQKGLLHRDLKPSHLLVTEVDGRPHLRIIDFGIALALERESHLDVGRDDTEVVGTPGYMSPEQIEGSGDVDTRSDIYALGVILYELLVGVSPFDTGRRRGWAAVAAQLEDLPTPTRRLDSLDETQDTVASHRRTTPRGLRKALHGDLDSIVSRAMSKNRADRYETARDLWLDLERYLAFRPVEARGGGPLYRVRRFARRNRVGVVVAGVVAAALVAVGTTAAAQAARVAEARDAAALRRAQAEELIDFMLTDLRDRLEPIGRLDVLDAVGDQALAYLATVPEADVTDNELFRRVTALIQIGEVRVLQGDLSAARAAFDGALMLNRGLAERSPENDEWQVSLGAAEYYVGYVDWRRGELDSALEHFNEYLAISQGLVSVDPTNTAWQTELGYSHSNIGSVLEDQGDLEGARERFTTALDIFREVDEQEPDSGLWMLNLADTHNTFGDVLRGEGYLHEALEQFSEEVRIKRALVALDSSHAFWRERLAFGHTYLGDAYRLVGALDSARVHFARALDGFSELVELDSTNVDWRRALAKSRQEVALLTAGQGQPVAALAQLRAVEAIRQELSATDPTDPRWKREEAETFTRTANVLHGLGREAEALGSVRRALVILDTLARGAPDDREVLRYRAEAYNTLGAIRDAGGDSVEAWGAWTEALTTIETEARGSRDVRHLDPWARALLHLERIEEARAVLERLAGLGYRDRSLARLADSKGVRTPLGVQ